MTPPLRPLERVSSDLPEATPRIIMHPNPLVWGYAMLKRFVFLCVLPLVWSTNAFAQEAPITDCDGYAAADHDPQRKSTGISIDKINPSLAVPACEAAVQQYPDSSRLVFQLGRAYEKANNFEAAVAQYRKAADQGYAGAQHNLGMMYAKGQGVPRDYAQALSWFRKAADQGHAGAQNNLGFVQSCF
jgi:tetratricopeptide (TPR) repeat protein